MRLSVGIFGADTGESFECAGFSAIGWISNALEDLMKYFSMS
jgi:hypothetical protein